MQKRSLHLKINIQCRTLSMCTISINPEILPRRTLRKGIIIKKSLAPFIDALLRIFCRKSTLIVEIQGLTKDLGTIL